MPSGYKKSLQFHTSSELIESANGKRIKRAKKGWREGERETKRRRAWPLR